MWARMGGWLCSLSMLDCWRKGEEWKEAECRAGHRIPGEHCECGIWAFYNVANFEREMSAISTARVPYTNRFQYVSGVIGAVGRIVPHEDGFRAQYAKLGGEDPNRRRRRLQSATLDQAPIAGVPSAAARD
jgi:hypothetical protein